MNVFSSSACTESISTIAPTSSSTDSSDIQRSRKCWSCTSPVAANNLPGPLSGFSFYLNPNSKQDASVRSAALCGATRLDSKRLCAAQRARHAGHTSQHFAVAVSGGFWATCRGLRASE